MRVASGPWRHRREERVSPWAWSVLPEIFTPASLPLTLNLAQALVKFFTLVLRKDSTEATKLHPLQSEIFAGFRHSRSCSVVLDIVDDQGA